MCKGAQVSLRAMGLCGMVGGFFCLSGFFWCSIVVFCFSFILVSLYTPCMLRGACRFFNAISLLTYQKTFKVLHPLSR
jgi:hypothetical protein